MATSRRWFGVVRRKLLRRSHTNITIMHTPSPTGQAIVSGRTAAVTGRSQEDIAAIKIQAFFRGHLARRAFRALKSLVKLQAVARGVQVRRQARIALHCMHALARLQVRVRARQLLSQCSDD